MEVRKMRATDSAHIREWLIDRAMSTDLILELPKIGFIAIEDGQGIGAAFLRMVEGGYALLDSLITNPKAGAHRRHVAIDLLVKECLETAKLIGLKDVLAYCADASTLERSIKHGFIKLPHAMIKVIIDPKRSIKGK